jgi:hypothetical protein
LVLQGKKDQNDTVIRGTLYHCHIKKTLLYRPDKDAEFRHFRSVGTASAYKESPNIPK